jgi:hypothetical protein
MVMRRRTTRENVPIGLPTSSKTIVAFEVAIKLILVWLYSVDSGPNERNTNEYTPLPPPPNQIYKHVLMPWKTPQCGFLWWSISLLVFVAELCTSFFWGIISIVFFVLLGVYIVIFSTKIDTDWRGKGLNVCAMLVLIFRKVCVPYRHTAHEHLGWSVQRVSCGSY